MEKQRGMAFGYRKTATPAKKARETDSYLIRKNGCTSEKSLLLRSE